MGGGHPAPPHPFILQNCVIQHNVMQYNIICYNIRKEISGFPPCKKYGGAGSIVWGLGFWSGKYILGFSKKLIWTIVRAAKNDSYG